MEAEGLSELIDVPDANLNALQQRVKHCTLNNEVFHDREGAIAALPPDSGASLFLDFETAMLAVPIWAGTRPYQQVPFQYSLHRVESDSSIIHMSFLDLSGNNPSRALAEALIKDCGAEGPIYVYNAGFERGVILRLAEAFPELSVALLAIAERLVDLLPVTRNHYYHPDQKGSWSIKAVLPTVSPDLAYAELEGVADGSQAMDAFAEAVDPSTSAERKAQIHQELEDYCRLDTLAMVRLWKYLKGDATD